MENDDSNHSNKQRKSSLTSFGFHIPDNNINEEGVLSKIFDRVLHAVSSGTAHQHEAITSKAAAHSRAASVKTRTSSMKELQRDEAASPLLLPNTLTTAQQPTLSKHLTLDSLASTTPATTPTNTASSSLNDIAGFSVQLAADTVVVPRSTSSTTTTATTTTTVTVGNQKMDESMHGRSRSQETMTHHGQQKKPTTIQFAVPITPVTSYKSQQQMDTQDALDFLLHNAHLTKRKSIDSDTQSVVTNFSISNSNSLSRILSRLRGQKASSDRGSDAEEFWMPDEQCKECYKCRKPFTLLRRKHHCRTCGQIFCGKCASHIISGKAFKQKGQVRVCNFCYAEQIQQLNELAANNSSINYAFSSPNNANVHQQQQQHTSSTAFNSTTATTGTTSSTPPLSSPINTQNTYTSSPIIPTQKPPLAVPQMQIPTAAFKHVNSAYGNDDTTTFALEIPTQGADFVAGTGSPYISTTAHYGAGSFADSPAYNIHHNNSSMIPTITTTSSSTNNTNDFTMATGGLKRIFDASTSFLKAGRPRSNTSSSAPLLDDHNHRQKLPQSPWGGNAYPFSLYLDRGGGTVLAESELSPFPGIEPPSAVNNPLIEDSIHHHQSPLHHQLALSSSSLTSPPPSSSQDLQQYVSHLSPKPSYAHHYRRSITDQQVAGAATVVGSDDESYDHRLRLKRTEELRGSSSLIRRLSLTGSQQSMSSGNLSTPTTTPTGSAGTPTLPKRKRLKSHKMRINTIGLPKSFEIMTAGENSRSSSPNPLKSTSLPFLMSSSNGGWDGHGNEAHNGSRWRLPLPAPPPAPPPPPPPPPPVFNRSHRRLSTHGPPPQTVELSLGARTHARLMLRQLMNDLDEEHCPKNQKNEWEEVIMQLLLKVTNCVQPDIRAGDDMDVRHYVKIKKIPGGKPSDSFYVKGVVCTKNVAHKRMLTMLSHPQSYKQQQQQVNAISTTTTGRCAQSRILILMFSLDYSRVEMENQLLSIAPVISQEREHIKKLVGRIVALKPSLLLVKSTVSRLALEILLQNQIPVIHNVKHSVIEAVARCTQASIITSLDKLSQHQFLQQQQQQQQQHVGNPTALSLGKCGSFEIRTIMHEWLPNRRKTFLIFDDCAPELGGTIVLRGAPLETLRVFKRLIDFMVFVVNNLKLETSLLLDSFAKTRNLAVEEKTNSLVDENADEKKKKLTQSLLSHCIETTTAEDLQQQADEEAVILTENSHYISGLLKLYQTTLLSVSQSVEFPPPYLLVVLKETEDQLAKLHLLKRRKKSISMSSIMTNNTSNNNNKENTTMTGLPLSASPTRTTFEKQPSMDLLLRQQQQQHVDNGQAAFLDEEYYLLALKNHRISRAWDAYIGENPESISPFYHQNIVVLYSSVCTITTVPCQGPEIRIFNFYRFPSDKTLGQYVIDLCNDSQQPCSSVMCHHPMMMHYHSYAHGTARINVMIEPFPCPLPGMSDKLLMWSYCKECQKPTPVLPMSENTWNYSFGKFLEILMYQRDVYCRADICPHEMTEHHVRYFGYNDLCVRFQYDAIELLEVSTPPMKLFIQSKVQMDLKEQELKLLRSKIIKFYTSVIERNKNFPFDLVDPKKLEACKAELQEISLEAQGEKKDALQLLQNVYATTDPTDTLTIHVVRRNLFQVVAHWDAVYADLVQFYLQPERELKKLTTNQLRKMFPSEEEQQYVANERTKRAAEVIDLPLLSLGFDDDDIGEDEKEMLSTSDEVFTGVTLKNKSSSKRKKPSVSVNATSNDKQTPSIMPVLSTSPSVTLNGSLATEEVNQRELDTELHGDKNSSSFIKNTSTTSFLRPEVRRRLSLDLLHELKEKFGSSNRTQQSHPQSQQQEQQQQQQQQQHQLKTMQLIPFSHPSVSNAEEHLTINKSPGTTNLSAAFTPSRIPVPRQLIRPSEASIYSQEKLIDEDRSFTERQQKERQMKQRQRHSMHIDTLLAAATNNSTLTNKKKRSRHSRHHSIGHSQNMILEEAAEESREGEHDNEATKTASTDLLNPHYLSRRSSTSRAAAGNPNGYPPNNAANNNNAAGQQFRSRLPRKKTSIQVYTKANDLVLEDLEDEFFIEGRHRTVTNNNVTKTIKNDTASIDYFSSLAPLVSGVIAGSSESDKPPSATKQQPTTDTPSTTKPYFHENQMDLFSSTSSGFGTHSGNEEEDSAGNNGSKADLPSASDLLALQRQQQVQDQQKNDIPVIAVDIENEATATTLLSTAASDSSSLVHATTTIASNHSSNLEDVVRHSAEKMSFMKTLTNFLTDSGIGNLLPLESPFQPTEYLFPDSYVVVREDEPSTIIAYTLSSEDYLDKMYEIQQLAFHRGVGSDDNNSTLSSNSTNSAHELSNINTAAAASMKDLTTESIHTTEKSNAGAASNAAVNMAENIQETLLRDSGTHMRYNFSTGNTKFFCKIFFAEQFDALRRNCGCDESYIMSLASCKKWDSSGGKSGSAFLKTADDRLLMKQMSKYELDAFLGFAPAYFQYMSEALFSELPTVLAKIFGFYSIGYKNSSTGKSMRMDVLVMENLFYQRNVKKIFDLKGSMRNRHVQSTGKQDEVLLDENLVELIYQSPLFIRAHSKEVLRSSLHNDTLFLSNRNVMDYSLLVGIDEEKQELVVGIVDFIRTFTWDKKLESWVKESGILGGGGKGPTIVSPRQYRIRFREAMERYFLMVPDFWALTRYSRISYSSALQHYHHAITAQSDSDEE